MIEGHELLKRYRAVVGELERDGHVKFEKPGKFSSAVKSVNFSLSTPGKKSTLKELDVHFGRAVANANAAGELIENLDDHTSRNATLPRTKQALVNLRKIHPDLRAGLIRYFHTVLDVAQNFGTPRTEAGREVVKSAVFTIPPGGKGVAYFTDLAEIAARHLQALKVKEHEVDL